MTKQVKEVLVTLILTTGPNADLKSIQERLTIEIFEGRCLDSFDRVPEKDQWEFIEIMNLQTMSTRST